MDSASRGIEMKSRYVAAFIVAAMMVAAFPIMASADDSDATLGTTTGQYTIFYYDSTSGAWDHTTASTYDAAQALKASGFWLSGDSMVDKTTGGNYPSPNYNYGDITTFRGITESGDNSWHVLVYQDGSWVTGSSYIGWYTCFSDQPSSWKTANFALYYGVLNTSSMISSLGSYVDDEMVDYSPETTVSQGNSNFAFTFYLKFAYSGATPEIASSGNVSVTTEELSTGKTITAYGSNAYLALQWAFGTNVSAVESIPGIHSEGDGYDYWTFYSWINSLFGCGTIQTAGQSTPTDWTDDSYAYWCIYTSYTALGDGANVLADYVIGEYAPLTCAEIADNTIALVYENVPMS